MSRTNKGSKGAGYDFWSRRAGNESKCNSPGPITKLITHRKERRENDSISREELSRLQEEKNI